MGAGERENEDGSRALFVTPDFICHHEFSLSPQAWTRGPSSGGLQVAVGHLDPGSSPG